MARKFSNLLFVFKQWNGKKHAVCAALRRINKVPTLRAFSRDTKSFSGRRCLLNALSRCNVVDSWAKTDCQGQQLEKQSNLSRKQSSLKGFYLFFLKWLNLDGKFFVTTELLFHKDFRNFQRWNLMFDFGDQNCLYSCPNFLKIPSK